MTPSTQQFIDILKTQHASSVREMAKATTTSYLHSLQGSCRGAASPSRRFSPICVSTWTTLRPKTVTFCTDWSRSCASNSASTPIELSTA